MLGGALTNRGTFYCRNSACGDSTKGVFWLHYAPDVCPSCRRPGVAIEETSGPKAVGSHGPWSSVEVDFDYDPARDRYRKSAIVIIDADEGDRWLIRSPLVHTEQRALVVAETTLASLTGSGEPKAVPLMLSTDDTNYFERLEAWAKSLESHALVTTHGQ